LDRLLDDDIEDDPVGIGMREVPPAAAGVKGTVLGIFGVVVGGG